MSFVYLCQDDFLALTAKGNLETLQYQNTINDLKQSLLLESTNVKSLTSQLSQLEETVNALQIVVIDKDKLLLKSESYLRELDSDRLKEIEDLKHELILLKQNNKKELEKIMANFDEQFAEEQNHHEEERNRLEDDNQEALRVLTESLTEKHTLHVDKLHQEMKEQELLNSEQIANLRSGLSRSHDEHITAVIAKLKVTHEKELERVRNEYQQRLDDGEDDHR